MGIFDPDPVQYDVVTPQAFAGECPECGGVGIVPVISYLTKAGFLKFCREKKGSLIVESRFVHCPVCFVAEESPRF
jgi:hypothetical protein